VKEIERIRLGYSPQLGSLEDHTQVKRMTPAHIRKLRAQAHKQSQLHFSIMRSIVTGWAQLRSSISLLFTCGTNECAKNGHRPQHYGTVVRCCQCGTEIKSMDQLVRLD
jgi:hypothetical protein